MTTTTPREPEIDRGRQQEATSYAAMRRLLLLLDLGIGALLLFVLLVTGWSRQLASVAAELGRGRLGEVAIYFLLFWSGYALLQLPQSIYSGWQLPRRHGLSVQSFGQWVSDWAKGQAISMVLVLVVVEVIYWLLAVQPDWWWLAAAGVVILFTVVLANLAPVLVLPLFYRLTPLGDEPLARRLKAMADSVGSHVMGVYRINLSAKTTTANAALMGLGNTRRVVLGDTLLERYTDDEIAVIFAHELGHHVHRDIPKLVATQMLVALMSFAFADVALRWGVDAFRYASSADVAAFPILTFAIAVAGLIAMPLANAFSRHVEYQADRYALECTGNVRAFIGAMKRLANQNLAEYAPPAWVELLLYDHPSIAHRIARAEAFGQAESGPARARQ